MLANELYSAKEWTTTPARKFPVTVQVEETRWKYKITFTDNMDVKHETEWLWKGKLADKGNLSKIESTLEKADDDIQSNLHRNIRRSMADSDRQRQIEARVHRLFN